MSENLKRAESLFNRIMNQKGNVNKGEEDTSNTGQKNNWNRSSNTSGHVRQNSAHRNNGHSGTGPKEKYSSGNRHNSFSTRGGHGFKDSAHKGNYGAHRHGKLNAKGNFFYNRGIQISTKNPAFLSSASLQETPSDYHILPYCWTFWHHLRSRPKQVPSVPENETDKTSTNASPEVRTGSHTIAAAVDSYLQSTNEIEFPLLEDNDKTTFVIASLEQMWLSMSLIKRPYELPIGTEFLFFKSGIAPVWEDPRNSKGGRWIFRFNRRAAGDSDSSVISVRERTSLIWERLLMRMVTGSLFPEELYTNGVLELLNNDIAGLVVSIRKDEDIISLWNTNLKLRKKTVDPKEEDSGKNFAKKIPSPQARKNICVSILRVIAECDAILNGADPFSASESHLSERVQGVSFDYRLHSDNNSPSLALDGKSNFRRLRKYN